MTLYKSNFKIWFKAIQCYIIKVSAFLAWQPQSYVKKTPKIAYPNLRVMYDTSTCLTYLRECNYLCKKIYTLEYAHENMSSWCVRRQWA